MNGGAAGGPGAGGRGPGAAGAPGRPERSLAPLAALGRVNALLDRATRGACVAILAAIFAIMLLQIAFRYALNAPLVWTEELARYLYIWACYLGAAVALRRGTHIAITLLPARLPPRLAAAVLLGTQGLGLGFLLGLAVLGVQLMARTHTVLAITLPIPWSAIYAAAPVAAGLMSLQTLEAMGRTLAAARDPRS
jgi:TRAP-type C4-dicarboxylate transport system permease small subunit